MLKHANSLKSETASERFGGKGELQITHFLEVDEFNVREDYLLKTVDFGTNGGKTLLVKTRMLELLERNFQGFGLSRISHDHFAASESNTIANYIARELGIPAVQIEINRKYRVPAQNPQGFHRLLGALVASVRELPYSVRLGYKQQADAFAITPTSIKGFVLGCRCSMDMIY